MDNKIKIPRTRNPQSKMFSFRMSPEAINKLTEISMKENIGVRTLVREIIFAYLYEHL